MPFEWFVALRYLREGRMQTLLILSGVAVGVGVIIFLAALIDGLQTSLIQKTLGSQPQITVRVPDEIPRLLPGGSAQTAVRLEKPARRPRSIDQWATVDAELRNLPGIEAVSPAASGPALVQKGLGNESVVLRGIVPDRFNRIVDVRDAITAGEFRVQGADAVLGTELASNLGVSVGEKIRIVVTDQRSQVFTVAGIFDLGNKEVNASWALVSLRSAQTLLDLSGGVTDLECKVGKIFDAETIARRIEASTGLEAESWMSVNAQLLVGLKSQNSSRYMIQTFVVIAVALGIASVLVVWVVQKNREIGILRAVGTTREAVLRIFLIQGAILGAGGWVLGAVLGTGLSHFFRSLAKNPDGTPTFPVDITLRLFLGTAVLAIAIGFLAAVSPARRAAKLDPVKAIYHI